MLNNPAFLESADIEVTGATEKAHVAALMAADSPRRNGEDIEHIRTLAEIDPPPVVVHRSTMRVIDGMHRLRAAELRGDEYIEVRYFDGSEEDAFVLAVKLNIAHGLPLSHADRVAAAARILATHPHRSDRWVATVAGIAPSTAAAVRQRSAIGSLNARLGLDGRIRPVDAAERRMRASKMIAERPNASLREIATAAGISVATAKDVRDRIRSGAHPLPPKLRDRGRRGERGAQPSPDKPQVQRTPRLDLKSVVVSMRMDPSMRNDSGRFLIQSMHAFSAENNERWRSLVDNLPGHRVEMIAKAAQECAEQWQWFADELGRRAT